MIPERLEDAKLEVSEAMRREGHSGDYDRSNITVVVTASSGNHALQKSQNQDLDGDGTSNVIYLNSRLPYRRPERVQTTP